MIFLSSELRRKCFPSILICSRNQEVCAVQPPMQWLQGVPFVTMINPCRNFCRNCAVSLKIHVMYVADFWHRSIAPKAGTIFERKYESIASITFIYFKRAY
jgi:hypothetical protein